MSIQTPYYNFHQIVVGLYTDGNEFVLPDGSDYIGLYHKLPNQQVFTGARPELNSLRLLEKRIEQTPDGLLYNNVKQITYPNYVVPRLTVPSVSSDDYMKGNISRFFVQKRNSPKNSIMEIDYIQYNTINTTNKPGINGIIYNKLKLNWIVSKIPPNDAAYINELTLIKSEQTFPFIRTYLSDFLEYYR